MNPEMYLARVDAPASPRCAREKAALATTLGAFHWSFLLGEDAGEGWASDCVSVTRRSGGLEIAGTSTWDSESDATEFAQGLRSFLDGKKDLRKTKVDRKGAAVSFRWTAPGA